MLKFYITYISLKLMNIVALSILKPLVMSNFEQQKKNRMRCSVSQRQPQIRRPVSPNCVS